MLSFGKGIVEESVEDFQHSIGQILGNPYHELQSVIQKKSKLEIVLCAGQNNCITEQQKLNLIEAYFKHSKDVNRVISQLLSNLGIQKDGSSIQKRDLFKAGQTSISIMGYGLLLSGVPLMGSIIFIVPGAILVIFGKLLVQFSQLTREELASLSSKGIKNVQTRIYRFKTAKFEWIFSYGTIPNKLAYLKWVLSNSRENEIYQKHFIWTIIKSINNFDLVRETCEVWLEDHSSQADKNLIESIYGLWEGDCAICLDQLTTEDVFVTECTHPFHESCFYRLLEHNLNKCPVCRSKIEWE